MVELEINGEFIYWTQSFLTDKRLKLVIVEYLNQEDYVETDIPN